MTLINPFVFGGGGAPAFTPTDIAGLTFWLDATQITPVADGSAISAWSDLSSTGANVAQATGANQPLYKTGIANGNPVVRFDGSNDYLQTSTTYQFINATTGAWTAFAVMSKTAYSGVRGVLTQDAVNGGGRIAETLRWNGSTSDTLAWNGPQTDTGPAGSGTAFHVDEAVRSTTTLERLVDGVTNGTTASASPITSASGMGVGFGTAQSGVQSFHNGDIAEIVYYNTALSSGDRTTVREYLATKWGVTL